MSRTRLPKGKGWFIWVITQTMGGNPAAIAAAAKAAGVGHVFWHIHDGYLPETRVPGGADLTPFIAAMKAVGIESWGWGAVYRSTWSQGADRAIEAMRKHPDLVGYILDAEAPIKNAHAEATALMKKLRYYLPSMPIGLSSYRFPKYHPELPWTEFRSQCDFDIPQVYWEQNNSDTAGSQQLQASYNEFQNMVPKLPFVPTGAAYKAGGWQPTSKQVKGFLDQARKMNLPGANCWVWYHTQLYLPDVYNTIMNYQWDVTPEQPDLTLEEKVNWLWDHHPELHY
jgi:hypothetical protein